jgi:DNA relaxase NicK
VYFSLAKIFVSGPLVEVDLMCSGNLSENIDVFPAFNGPLNEIILFKLDDVGCNFIFACSSARLFKYLRTSSMSSPYSSTCDLRISEAGGFK